MNRLKKTPCSTLFLPCYLIAAVLSYAAGSASAATILKADNANNLNLGTSWVGGVAPGSGDVASWDSTVTDPNTTNTLGANLSFGGITILNPAGAVTITTNSGGNTLTLGGSGIDLSAATADLIMSNNLTIPDRTLQSWKVPSGRTLALEGAFTRSGGSLLTLNNSGTINLAQVATNTVLNYVLTANATDVACVDAFTNVSTVAAVKTYTGNVVGALPTTQWTDLINGSPTTADDIYCNTSIYFPSVIRFNTPQPNRSYWSCNAYKGQFSIGNQSTYLVTTNVGACDIFFKATGSGGITLRFGHGTEPGSELILDQENTLGSVYFSGAINQKSSFPDNMITKRGAGRVVFNTALGYSGPTRIMEGEVMVNSSSLSSSVFTVSPGATLSGIGTITGIATNSGTVWPGTNGLGTLAISNLTMNAGSSLKFYATALPMTNTTALLIITNPVVNGAVNVNIAAGVGTLGQYPLVKSVSGAFSSGAFANFTLAAMPPRTTGYLSNNTAALTVDLVITNVDEPLTWATGSGTWDTNGANIWQDLSANLTSYQEMAGVGDSVLFEDTLSGASPITVTVNNTLVPATTTFNNSSKTYTLSGNGSIAGAGNLTKSGSGTLTLATTNSFTGGIVINGGVVSFTTISNLGAGNISFGGGTLQYNGNSDDISGRTVTLGAGGGTINDGGNTITFANPIGNAGAGGLTKAGAGTLTLNGTNKYSGNTIINQGTLALGGAAYISNSAAIIVNSGAVLDTASSGVGLTLSTPASQILAGVGTVSGAVTASAGTTMSPATNGVYGTLTLGSLTISGGTLAMDVSTTVTHDLIAVTGNLTINSGSLLVLAGGPLANGTYQLITYGGSLTGGAASVGNLTVVYSQVGKAVTLDGSTPGEIDLIVADSASDVITWAGAANAWDTTSANWLNGATPWVYTNGDFVTFDNSGLAQPTVLLQGAFTPSSITVSNDAANYDFQDGTGSGGGKIAGVTGINKAGAGTLIIETANVNTGPTVIGNGTVQIGNGNTGDLGSGNVTNNGALVFAQGDSNTHTVGGQISGAGTVTQQGASTVVLSANNTYSGATTINGGVLQLGTGGTTGTTGTNAITDNAMLVLNRSGTVVLSNNILGSGALTKIGASTLSFGVNPAYQGNTYISNGVVKLTGNDQIPDANSVAGSTGWLILDGGSTAGTFDLAGFNETINSLSGLSGTVNGVVTNSGASTTTTNTLAILENAATVYNGVIAENSSGSKVQVALHGNSELQLNGNSTFSAGMLVADTATLGLGVGGVPGTGTVTFTNTSTLNLHIGGFIGNTINIADGSAARFNSLALANSFSGNVNGGSTASNIIVGPISAGASAAFQYGGFSGTVQIPTGGTLRFSSTSLTYNGGTNTTFDLEGGVLQTRNTGTIYVGALEGASGSIENPQANTGTGTFIIGTKNIDTTFSGGINGTNNIVKAGTASLTLEGALSYVGSTTVSNGVLVLGVTNNAVSLDNSPTISLRASTAVIDVSGRSDGTLNLGNSQPQVLNGLGTIRGSLSESTTTTNNLTLGVLNVTNVATLGGALNMQINDTNTPNCSELVAHSFVISGGSVVLTVNNVGSTNLVAGDTFRLFSTAVANFAAINLPSLPSPQLYWTNNIAVNGSISIVSSVNTNPTNITFNVSGNTLNLSWPADHTGWTLQVQTNTLSTGLGTNWVDVPGSTAIDSTNIVMDPNNPSVFFRLKY